MKMNPALVVVVTLVASAPADAATERVGLYMGLSPGYAWDDAEASFIGDGGTATNILNAGALPVSQSTGHVAFAGGLQLGYNWRVNGLWVGIEGDYSKISAGSSNVVVTVQQDSIQIIGPNGGVIGGFTQTLNRWSTTATADASYLATLRGRVGLQIAGNVLYATGGFAFADYSSTADVTRSAVIDNGVRDSWTGGVDGHSVGWILGGGIERAVTERWVAKVEALYYDFGSKDYALTQVLIETPGTTNIRLAKSDSAHGVMARLGVSYSF
jgi:outer membrane immunogenic protein